MVSPLLINFVGVGRLHPPAVLAAIFAKKTSKMLKIEIENNFQQIIENLNSSKRSFPGNQEKFKFKEGYMYLLVDDEASCVYAMAVPYDKFVDKSAFSILQEVTTSVALRKSRISLSAMEPGKLTPIIKTRVRGLMEKHQSVELSEKSNEVEKKLSEAKGVMENNVKRILETTAAAETLTYKSWQLNNSTNTFNSSSRNLHSIMWWRRMKVAGVGVVVITSAVIYAILLLSGV